MRAIDKYIIVKTIEEEIKTASGLLLSADDASSMRYKKGKVIMPGTNVSVIHVDDIIHYDSRAGYTMLIENDDYTIITERDVVVVL